jgi:hypothetical protein
MKLKTFGNREAVGRSLGWISGVLTIAAGKFPLTGGMKMPECLFVSAAMLAAKRQDNATGQVNVAGLSQLGVVQG